MLRIFSAVTVCTILATQMPSKALSSTATLGQRLFQFLQALQVGDVLYTTKASYPQRQSRVDCVMRTKTVSDNTVARLCMQTNINSRRLPPFPMKLSYRRTSNGDVVTEGLSSGPRNTLTIHYVDQTCVVYSVKELKPLTSSKKACGIWSLKSC
uniref:Putative secreted protein n=1 Tax=Ixodes ricinus TaxID=34613 RepID=A0A090XES5_IXORI